GVLKQSSTLEILAKLAVPLVALMLVGVAVGAYFAFQRDTTARPAVAKAPAKVAADGRADVTTALPTKLSAAAAVSAPAPSAPVVAAPSEAQPAVAVAETNPAPAATDPKPVESAKPAEVAAAPGAKTESVT